MKIILTKKPKNPTIIEGFPGFGLVGTIASEFLIDHLDTEQIGKIWISELPAMVAVHEGKVVEPIGIFYNKKYNIVIVHGIIGVTGFEWKITDAIINMAKDLKAKEVISLEGIGSAVPAEKTNIFTRRCSSIPNHKPQVTVKTHSHGFISSGKWADTNTVFRIRNAIYIQLCLGSGSGFNTDISCCRVNLQAVC